MNNIILLPLRLPSSQTLLELHLKIAVDSITVNLIFRTHPPNYSLQP